MTGPLTTNDGVVLGFLVLILAFVFQTARSRHPGFRGFYSVVPPLLICYFAPSVLTSLGVYDPDQSNLYFVASRFLLPASLVLLTVRRTSLVVCRVLLRSSKRGSRRILL